MALTYSDLDSKTNVHIIPFLTDTVYKASPTFVRIKSKNNHKFEGGLKFRHPLTVFELNGGAFSRGGTFDTSYVTTDTALEGSIKYYYVNCTLYGTDAVLNRGPEAAIDLVKSKLANAAGKMAKLLATDMYLDGQGTNSATSQLDGFQGAFDNGSLYGSYLGIDRSDIVADATNCQGINGYVASLATGFTLKAVQKAYGSTWFGTQHVDLISSDQNSWDHFWNKLQPLQRIYDESSDVARAGFQAFKFNGSQVVVDQYAPSGEMYGINTDPENLLFIMSTLPRYQFGFTGWKTAQNTDDVAGQYLFAGNICVPASRFNFRLTAIPTA